MKQKDKTSAIKLLKLDELSDGTQRFQSQLLVSTNTADFIMGSDNVMKCFGSGKQGHGFYKYNKPYEILSSKSDMAMQVL